MGHRDARSSRSTRTETQADDLEEAVLEMDKTRDYLVYRDAETDRCQRPGAPPRRTFRPGRGIAARHMPRKKAAEPKEAPPHKPELVVITGLERLRQRFRTEGRWKTWASTPSTICRSS